MKQLKIDKFYYKEGTKFLHREDGPAVEYRNGTKLWYQNDKCHRLDGPAVELNNGIKRWHLDGQIIDCNSQQEFESSPEFRSFKLKAFW